MSEVYVGNLFADEDDRDDYQQYCFGKPISDKSIYAIGWAVKAHPNNIKEYEDIAEQTEYDTKKGKKKGCEIPKFESTINTIKQLNAGDFIWTRRPKTGEYWLGKVSKEVSDISEEDFYQVYQTTNPSNHDYCLSVPCEKWVPLKIDSVPGIVSNSFYGHVICHSSASSKIFNYCQYLYGDIKELTLSVDSLKKILSPDDEEDLLGLYLQKEKHYLIYPSTNKRGTAAFEYMLAKQENGSIQKAICQCKMGNTDIELEDFEDYKTFEIYCVTDEGKVKYKGNTYEGDKPNVHVLSLMDLLIWAKKKENIDILPDRIKKYLSNTDF